MAQGKAEVTQLLANLHDGDEQALDQLFNSVYHELEKIARKNLRSYAAKDGVDAVALVNEVYMKLVDTSKIQSKNRGQFYALASRAMRNILVDWIRHNGRKKRGGNMQPVHIDDVTAVYHESNPTVLMDLDMALQKLAKIDPDAEKVVECRFFSGMTLEEIAEALDIPLSRVRSRWQYAKAWLYDTLKVSYEAGDDTA